MGGGRSKPRQLGPLLTIRDLNPDGMCFDANYPIKFEDIYYEDNNEDPLEKRFLVDDTQIQPKYKDIYGGKLPFLGQKASPGKDGKPDLSTLEGVKWGTRVNGFYKGCKKATCKNFLVEVEDRDGHRLPRSWKGGRVLVEDSARVQQEPKIAEKRRYKPARREKSIIVWEESPACPSGKVKINYSGGVGSQYGLRNGPVDEDDMDEKIHTYHVYKDNELAQSSKYQKAAEGDLCEDPPVKLKCTEEKGKVPKCDLAEFIAPKPKPPRRRRIGGKRRRCPFFSSEPEPEPEQPEVYTFQIAMQSVGGVCNPEPQEPKDEDLPEAEAEKAG